MLYLALLFAVFVPILSQPGTDLWEYVQFDDGFFSYDLLTTYDQIGITTYVYNMTSQKWRDETLIDKPIWYHYVTVHVPKVLDPAFVNNAFLFVGSGSWENGIPNVDSGQIRETGVYANRTGMVTGVIRQVPFQPLIFTDETSERTEDSIIAKTWRLFHESNATLSSDILLRFPMCKAVKRAMDLMTEVADDLTAGQVNLDAFMIAGSSKRGWTTWMMPPSDSRIAAIAPTVLSVLNINENMHHYWRSFGGWTFAFADYWIEDITTYIDHPNMPALALQVDPFSYRATMTMPKLLVSGASDEFFMPDDYNYFFDDLPGEKHIWILENTGHSISDGPLYAEYWEMLETFYIAVIKDRPRPSITSASYVTEPSGDGHIQVHLSEAANSVEVIYANSVPAVAPRREFRDHMLPELPEILPVETNLTWYNQPATNMGGNVWRTAFTKPDVGYRAFYLKINFPYAEEGRTFTITSKAHILSFDVDNEFPFEDCTMDSCAGMLV